MSGAKSVKTAKRKRLTPAQRLDLAYEQGWKCYWCGGWLTNAWHADHHVPLREGGSNELSNFRMYHPNCHAVKSSIENSQATGHARNLTTQPAEAHTPLLELKEAPLYLSYEATVPQAPADAQPQLKHATKSMPSSISTGAYPALTEAPWQPERWSRWKWWCCGYERIISQRITTSTNK